MCYAFIQPIPYMAIIWWHDEGNTLFGGTHRGYGGGASPLEGWGIARDKNLDINKYDMVWKILLVNFTVNHGGILRNSNCLSL